MAHDIFYDDKEYFDTSLFAPTQAGAQIYALCHTQNCITASYAFFHYDDIFSLKQENYCRGGDTFISLGYAS